MKQAVWLGDDTQIGGTCHRDPARSGTAGIDPLANLTERPCPVESPFATATSVHEGGEKAGAEGSAVRAITPVISPGSIRAGVHRTPGGKPSAWTSTA